MQKSLKSPVDGETMEAVTLDDGLQAHRCKSSGGYYITAGAYMDWLGRQPARLPHKPGGESSIPLENNRPNALICPESGTIMSRYKVGHGFKFSIDRSITGGIWLDAGEWEALRERNFHDEINLVFTAPWQAHVRDEAFHTAYEERLAEALGEDLFGRVQSLRSELRDHPGNSLAIAYLMDTRG
ncbi:MAG: hypothetical protein ACQCXQ_10205 [Verrucomicrobiales bacterium]|nr:hypothetical protein [Verrucomicrobiota bacterium JB025]